MHASNTRSALAPWEGQLVVCDEGTTLVIGAHGA
jgi:hypothetical protein